MNIYLGNLTKRAAALAALFFFFQLAITDGVLANSMQVSPTRAEVDNKNRNAVFEIFNPSENEIAVQVESVSWSQDGPREIYKKTRDILAVRVL